MKTPHGFVMIHLLFEVVIEHVIPTLRLALQAQGKKLQDWFHPVAIAQGVHARDERLHASLSIIAADVISFKSSRVSHTAYGLIYVNS